MSEKDVEFNPEHVKQFKLSNGNSIIAYLSGIRPDSGVFLLERPFQIIIQTNGSEYSTMMIPWMEYGDHSQLVTIMPHGVIAMADVSDAALDGYISGIKSTLGREESLSIDENFDLAEWNQEDMIKN